MSDFTFTPDNTFEETIQHKTLISMFENGTEQRRKKWSRPLRAFTLSFLNRTQDETNSIKDYFNEKSGAFGLFNWQNPVDSQTYTVRFQEDSLRVIRKAFNVFDCDITLVEVK